MAEPNDAPAFLTVDALMEPWRQGDIALVTNFQHFADLRRPVTSASRRLSESEGSQGLSVVRVGTEVEGLVVLTQTCDVQRPAARRPYVELCPLIRVDSETARAASARERPRYAAVPAMGSDAVADLDRVMTVEKGWLSYASRVPGWTTDDEIRLFQAAVARRYQRFAFPDDFVESMDKLRDRIVRRHGHQTSPEGQLFAIIKEIRVVASPHWSSDHIEATLFFILPGGTLPTVPDELIDSRRQQETFRWLATRPRRSPEVAERLLAEPDAASRATLWKRLADAWAELCEPKGSVQAIYAEAVDAREYCVEDYWQGAQLDLDYLSEPAYIPSDAEVATEEGETRPPSMLKRLGNALRIGRGPSRRG